MARVPEFSDQRSPLACRQGMLPPYRHIDRIRWLRPLDHTLPVFMYAVAPWAQKGLGMKNPSEASYPCVANPRLGLVCLRNARQFGGHSPMPMAKNHDSPRRRHPNVVLFVPPMAPCALPVTLSTSTNLREPEDFKIWRGLLDRVSEGSNTSISSCSRSTRLSGFVLEPLAPRS